MAKRLTNNTVAHPCPAPVRERGLRQSLHGLPGRMQRKRNATRDPAQDSAAKQFVNPEILSNPGVYPDEATFKRLFTNTAYDERSQRIVTRAWTRVKTGR